MSATGAGNQPRLTERVLFRRRVGAALACAFLALASVTWGWVNSSLYSLLPASMFAAATWQALILASESGSFAADASVRRTSLLFKMLHVRAATAPVRLAPVALLALVLIAAAVARSTALFSDTLGHPQAPGLLAPVWKHFKDGGWGMYVILVWGVITIAVIIERSVYLFGASINREVFLATMQRYIRAGDLAKAVETCRAVNAPLARVVQAGLVSVINKPGAEVQSAMDEATIEEIPRIAKRTGYLALLANLSMLSGLLGTVSGLIVSFGAVSGNNVDSSQKARILAEGISEAMNCTAFGLLVAIIGLIGFAVLNGKTQTLEDDINEASVRVLNLLATSRKVAT